MKKNSPQYDLSVIIPAYNMEKYIGRCLDSILKQENINIEIIVSDDGSFDHTAAIVKEYREKHQNIVLISHENIGVYSTRLLGVKNAKGKYITFCDADDYMDENGYTALVKQLETEKIDIIEFGLKRVSDDGIVCIKNYPEAYFKGNRCMLNALEKVDTEASVWNKVYKRELFEGFNLEYMDFLMYDEDIYMNVQLIKQSTVIKRVSDAFYNYYVREDSITTSKFEKKNQIVLKTNKEIYFYVKENYPECLQAAAIRYCTRLAWCYCMNVIYKIPEINADIKHEFIKTYKNSKIKPLAISNRFYKRKILLLTFRINPYISVFLMKKLELRK